MYQQVVQLGLEGIVAKRAASAYVSARSKDWFKIPAKKNDDFVVVGWSDPKGARVGLGSLHVAQWVDGKLYYSGGVGTGFDDATLKELYKTLKPLELEGPPPE